MHKRETKEGPSFWIPSYAIPTVLLSFQLASLAITCLGGLIVHSITR